MNDHNKKAVFRINKAKKYFGETKALDIGVPIEIHRGTTTVILGQSGSGKSTFLSLLGLMDDADEGSRIEYHPTNHLGNMPDGLKYEELSPSQKKELRKKAFGVAFQDGHLIGHIDTRDNVKLPMLIAGATHNDADVVCDSLIANLDLNRRRDSRPKELSGGEYQRVAIARAVAHNPGVVLADEPTGNLDTDTGKHAMDLLVAWRKSSADNTLILVTHDIHLAYHYADQFIVLENGGVKCCFSREELDNPDRRGDWKKCLKKPDTVGADVLLQLFDFSEKAGTETVIGIKPWNQQKTSFWRKFCFQFWYGLRDLFPIKIFPFNWSVFKTTSRDTIFPALTIVSIIMLVAVLLTGYGIFHGIKNYLSTVHTNNICANRLLAEIATDSSVSEITDTLIAELKNELSNIHIKPGIMDKICNIFSWEGNNYGVKPAVEYIEGVSNAELFVYKSNQDLDMVGARGMTVQPDSPLLSRVTFKGEKLPARFITSCDTEGVIFKASWLKEHLKLKGDAFPKNLVIQQGHSTGGIEQRYQEEIPLLGVVDDLPDGVFLISPGCWHKIRDGKWRPYYRKAKVLIAGGFDWSNKESVEEKINSAVKLFHQDSQASFEVIENEGTYLNVVCGYSTGWKKSYWQDVIFDQKITPLLKEGGIEVAGKLEFYGESSGNAPESPLNYIAAVVYITDIKAIEEVVSAIHANKAGLVVNTYVVNSYRMMKKIILLIALTLGFVAVCAFSLSTVNIFLMFYQNVLRKRHEIGILKAFGCSRLRIAKIFFVESLYVSVIGCGFGFLLAWYVGDWAGNYLSDIYELKAKGSGLFYLDWRIVTGILLFIVCLCEIITFVATSATAKKTANELLRQKG